MENKEKAILAAQIAATLLQPSLGKYPSGSPAVERDTDEALKLAYKIVNKAMTQYGVR